MDSGGEVQDGRLVIHTGTNHGERVVQPPEGLIVAADAVERFGA